jgi:hypothetical protein
MPVLAIDAATTGATALVVGEDGGVLSRGHRGRAARSVGAAPARRQLDGDGRRVPPTDRPDG